MAQHKPLVALETTLLCHGVPKDQALSVAQRLFSIVEQRGAEPTLIGIVDGQVRVGLAMDELAALLQRPVEKVGARGICGAMARGVCAATTVSATMAIAVQAGIKVFATGGIGGVHRGADDTFDESEDLAALGRFPVAVVSAGAKAILDLPKTVERLESYGVPVVGYGCDSFTAFYTNDSALSVAERVDNIDTMAKLIELRLSGRFGSGGLLVVNPVPADYDLGGEQSQRIVADALRYAQQQGATGAQATPVALAYINDLDSGRFLRTNIAVVESNAALAAEIAVAL